MSRFHLMQPVRVVAPASGNHGAETFVTAIEVAVTGCECYDYVGTEVAIPCTVNPRFPLCVFEDHELEPITPPDFLTREEIDALNEPEPIEALENAAMRRENHSFLSTLAEAAWMADTGAMP